jgi:hypothetical protein
VDPYAAQAPSSGSSFLDDWLKKKDTNNFRIPSSPFAQQKAAPQSGAKVNSTTGPQQIQGPTPNTGLPQSPTVTSSVQPANTSNTSNDETVINLR